VNTSITKRLASLGHTLQPATSPVANFQPTARIGNLLFISGQIGIDAGAPTYPGRLGFDLNLEQGYASARAAALGVLSHIVGATDDIASRVRRVVRVGVFVASTAGFQQHSQVANGASDLLTAVFGAAGQHVRTAVGVAALPLGASVEVEAVVEMVDLT
jgi:enamine deaminase RidA (YjgF/YER057c/UK114 family)